MVSSRVFDRVILVLIMLLFSAGIFFAVYWLDPRALTRDRPSSSGIPDRFAFHEKSRFDTEGGNLNGFEYEIYIDTKTGQKYLHLQVGHDHTFCPILEPKELIEEDIKKIFKSE